MLKPRLDLTDDLSVRGPSTPVAAVIVASDERGNTGEGWKRACRRLKAEVGDPIYNSWFGRLALDELSDGTAQLSVPTKFLKSWIQSHFTDRILAVLASEIQGVERISITVRSSSQPHRGPRSVELGHSGNQGFAERASPAQMPESHALPATPAPAPDSGHARSASQRDVKSVDAEPSGSPLDKRLTFATFVTGRSNELAYGAALRLAKSESSEALRYNPLYIHGSVGLGKTHLLQATAHAASDTRRVIYLTAEKFMYGFVSALKTQNAIAFKEKLRHIDLLVIDDVQFLQGKIMQQEFCHTLNALIDAGRQIIIAADRPPSELESIDERVRSRLAGGLCVEMGQLDEGQRVSILTARVAQVRGAQPGFDVSSAVISFVAKAIQSNGRDLDGAINRLVARSTLTGASLTVEVAEDAIRDLVRTREPKRVKIEDIQKLVANHFNVSRADILSSRRTATVVRPRQIAMYLSKILTLRSLPEIGRRFGGRDHTTVLHAVRKIEGLAQKDGALSEELEMLKRILME